MAKKWNNLSVKSNISIFAKYYLHLNCFTFLQNTFFFYILIYRIVKVSDDSPNFRRDEIEQRIFNQYFPYLSSSLTTTDYRLTLNDHALCLSWFELGQSWQHLFVYFEIWSADFFGGKSKQIYILRERRLFFRFWS